jgi:hypothetical protein
MAETVTEVGEGTVVTKVETSEVKPESTPETKEYSAIEQTAINQGWDPDYEGDNKRSAREFVDRGELLGKIKSQSEEIKAVKKIAETLSQQNKNVYIASYEKALKDLTAAKIEALDDGGKGKQIVQLDESIAETRIALANIKAQPVTTAKETGETETFKAFKEANSWYDTSKKMKNWAHGTAIEFAKEHENATEEQVYNYISKEVRKEYPEKFVKGPPSPDGEGRGNSGGNSQASKGSSKEFDSLMNNLPEDQARVAKDLVKRGYLTKEKYVEDYNNIPR